ncbi:uncharacterized protein EV420DRAFT_1481129 [Desarmillaria tabescens]|uniref:Uncharacterized protein n=1 Tax=Armillaria tabescens TaxID=1929756 RepID=A0AA39N3B3_ARMTA|nr:uncharacterized protein EV420DRAFT_1481129 [Desarmillaria tabescens]KAK0455675.1 hypothetical protein EV420DRAFT_1481129 [Desarmillaria tabescens]
MPRNRLQKAPKMMHLIDAHLRPSLSEVHKRSSMVTSPDNGLGHEHIIIFHINSLPTKCKPHSGLKEHRRGYKVDTGLSSYKMHPRPIWVGKRHFRVALYQPLPSIPERWFRFLKKTSGKFRGNVEFSSPILRRSDACLYPQTPDIDLNPDGYGHYPPTAFMPNAFWMAYSNEIAERWDYYNQKAKAIGTECKRDTIKCRDEDGSPTTDRQRASLLMRLITSRSDAHPTPIFRETFQQVTAFSEQRVPYPQASRLGRKRTEKEHTALNLLFSPGNLDDLYSFAIFQRFSVHFATERRDENDPR